MNKPKIDKMRMGSINKILCYLVKISDEKEGYDYNNPRKAFAGILEISRETGLDHKTVKKNVDLLVKYGTIIETNGHRQSRLLCHWMSGTGQQIPNPNQKSLPEKYCKIGGFTDFWSLLKFKIKNNLEFDDFNTIMLDELLSANEKDIKDAIKSKELKENILSAK